jgi:hypothetical protein
VLCRFRSNTDSESGLVVRNPFSFSFSYIYREMCLYAPCNNKSDFSCLLHNNKDGIVARIYVDSAGILGGMTDLLFITMFALPAGGSMNHHIIAAYAGRARALLCLCVDGRDQSFAALVTAIADGTLSCFRVHQSPTWVPIITALSHRHSVDHIRIPFVGSLLWIAAGLNGSEKHRLPRHRR